MKVIYRTHTAPTEAAPFGGLTGSSAIVLCDLDGGVLRIGPHSHAGATEGDQPGQWQRVSRSTTSGLTQLRNGVANLAASDPDPIVREMAQALLGALARDQVPAALVALWGRASDTGLPGTTRALALLAIGLIVAEERD